MAVRLQTAEGMIKKYETTLALPMAISENCYTNNYVTKCGRKWEYGSQRQECDHLECAISLAKHDKKDGRMGFIFAIVIGGIMLQFGYFASLGYLLVPVAFISVVSGLRAGNRLDELCEFSLKGTINGIIAWQIFEDPEEIKKKGWWQFWR
jgi:hypothetical protein